MIPRWPVRDPAETCQKVLRSCRFLQTDLFSKLFSCKHYGTLAQKVPCIRSPQAQFFFSRGIRPQETTLVSEYLREFETEFNNNLDY